MTGDPEAQEVLAAVEADEADDAPGEPIEPTDGADASLLALVDRLGLILDRSELTELEVEVGGTALILRKPEALPQLVLAAAGPASDPATSTAAVPASAPSAPAEPTVGAGGRPSIAAPLTGIWYASPTSGSAPFVEVGREVAVGQVVGLIEAMKLFNEIKSDIAGRVVRVMPESGTLVKAKQPLIEVEPL